MTVEYSSTLPVGVRNLKPGSLYFSGTLGTFRYFTFSQKSRNFMPKGATWSFIMSSYFGPHHLSAKPRRSESPYQNS